MDFQHRGAETQRDRGGEKVGRCKGGRAQTGLVENFVAMYRKPFSVGIICEMVGLDAAEVAVELERLKGERKVKEVEPGLWQALWVHNVNHSNSFNGYKWTYKGAHARKILDLLDAKEYTSARKLAVAMGVSRQFTYLYMEALASIGAVDWDGEKYVSTGRGDLLRLGLEVEKGILGRLKGIRRKEVTR